MKKLLKKIGVCKITILLSSLLLLSSLIINIIFLYYHYFKLDFEEVYKAVNEINQDDIIWQSTRCDSLVGDKYLREDSHLDNWLDVDLEKFTYIISYGYELVDLSISFSELKNSNGLYFVPKAIFKKEKKNTIYVYRLRKTNIDYDIHEISRNVFFV